jgi:hypothetical protein
MRWLLGPIFSALLLLSGSAFAASTINSLPTASFPLPDAGLPSASTLNLWIANGNGANSDFRITPNQLGYILQNCSAPTSPFRYELWWNTCANPAVEEVYTGTTWVIVGSLDYVNNIWSPPAGGAGIATLASAPTTDLGSVSNSVVAITGSANITSFGTTAVAGTIRFLRFIGTPTLAYNSSTQLIPGAASIVTAMNDTAVAIALGGGAWQIASYQPALSLYASLVSPVFSGTPTAPTASPGTDTLQLATTAFVATSFAPINSPTFTGTPTAPTPGAGDNSTKLATTGFITPTFAPLASPALSGIPTAPTAAQGDNTTQIATDAFVTGGAFAPLASPAFTGIPTAPTAVLGTNTTQLATTAFVIANAATTVSPTFTGTVTLPDGSTWGSGGLTATGNPIATSALGQISTLTLLGNATGGTANVASLTGGAVSGILCQRQRAVETSGTGTYTTPTCNGVTATWVSVWACGAGGGGGGSGSGSTNGGTGGATTFGPLTANGGIGSVASSSNGGGGGTASGGDVNVTGAAGGPAAVTATTNLFSGGSGGSSVLGGRGAGGNDAGAGLAAAANSCSGGGGPGSNGTGFAVGGGGAGGFSELLILAPSATYSYGVGGAGSAGSSGSGGLAGGAGGAGLILVDAGWQ